VEMRRAALASLPQLRRKVRFRGLSKPPHLKSHFHKCHIGHGLQGA
jgi:hypothetical protein